MRVNGRPPRTTSNHQSKLPFGDVYVWSFFVIFWTPAGSFSQANPLRACCRLVFCLVTRFQHCLFYQPGPSQHPQGLEGNLGDGVPQSAAPLPCWLRNSLAEDGSTSKPHGAREQAIPGRRWKLRCLERTWTAQESTSRLSYLGVQPAGFTRHGARDDGADSLKSPCFGVEFLSRCKSTRGTHKKKGRSPKRRILQK